MRFEERQGACVEDTYEGGEWEVQRTWIDGIMGWMEGDGMFFGSVMG